MIFAMWLPSLWPELLQGFLAFLFGGGLVGIIKARQADADRKRRAPFEQNSQIVQLTEKLQIMSQASVDQAAKDLKAVRDELSRLRVAFREQDVKLQRLERHQVEDSEWHVDHVRAFDDPARQIIERVAPDELPTLILRPYPRWEETA